MPNLKKLLVKIAAPVAVAFPALNALAQSGWEGQTQNDAAPLYQDVPLNPSSNLTDLNSLSNTISSWATMFAGVIGIIAVIMLIYAAFLYVTGGTDEGNVKKAKNIIIYAIIGIVVAVLSYAIVRVVISVAGSV